MSQLDFASLALDEATLTNLHSLGYKQMTQIQAQSLPLMLAGRDVIAQSKTGSGKTAAFGLGLLANLQVKRFRVQALVLCPTRELAEQVAVELRRLARATHNVKILSLCGGAPMGPQIGSLEHGAHIIVGTPGRIEEHLNKGRLSLNELNTLVLDEADRMLDMGFQDSIDAIIGQAPSSRQTLLFSATYPDKIAEIAARVMHNPQQVIVTESHDASSISEHFYRVEDSERMLALRLLLLQHQPQAAVIFCNTKRESQQVADELMAYGFSAMALHGDLDQKARDQALIRFSHKSVKILVATDVAARGLDIDELDAVINYQLSRETQVHTHRVGRTGRAGSKGVACSIYSERDDYTLALLEDYLDKRISSEPLPPLSLLEQKPLQAEMVSIQLDAGKKQKIRPGDILGALTGENGIEGKQVGKIKVAALWSYVAVHRDALKQALRKLEQGKLKGRSVRVRVLRS